jgi:transposase-like protein
MFAAEIRRNRVSRMRAYSNWQWHLDEVFVKINGVRLIMEASFWNASLQSAAIAKRH